jgi:hypothetical protein
MRSRNRRSYGHAGNFDQADSGIVEVFGDHMALRALK